MNLHIPKLFWHRPAANVGHRTTDFEGAYIHRIELFCRLYISRWKGFCEEDSWMLWSLLFNCSHAKKNRESNKRGRGRYTRTHQFVTSYLEQGDGHVWASEIRAFPGVSVGILAAQMRLKKLSSNREPLGLPRTGERYVFTEENAEHWCGHNDISLYGSPCNFFIVTGAKGALVWVCEGSHLLF